MKNIKLFIDDERIPKTDDFLVIRSFNEAVNFFNLFGCPTFISFDHDLGLDNDNKTIAKNGLDIVKWLIEKDIQKNGKFIPLNFTYIVHSMNPIGKDNIDGLLKSYLKFRIKEKN